MAPWRRKDPVGPEHPLRSRALAMDVEELALEPARARGVWLVLMELGSRAGVATLVTVADGSTSLYLGAAGGFIGAGAHEPVRVAAERHLTLAADCVLRMQPAGGTPRPGPGSVTFYVRDGRRLLGSEVGERTLQRGRHALSPLYATGQSVITAIREATDALGEPAP